MKFLIPISISLFTVSCPITLASFTSNNFSGGGAVSSNNGGIASRSFSGSHLGGSLGGNFGNGFGQGFGSGGGFSGSGFGSGSGLGSFFGGSSSSGSQQVVNQPPPPPPPAQDTTTTTEQDSQQDTQEDAGSSMNDYTQDTSSTEEQDSTEPKDPIEDGSSKNNEMPTEDGSGTTFKNVGGSSVYLRKFVAYGFIDKICVNIDEFCNGVDSGDPSAFVSCYAARQAVSQVQGAYSFEGSLRVGAGKEGVVNAIDLVAEANAAALALSFTETGSMIQAQATVEVGALAVSGSGLTNAEALALSNSTANAASVAFARSLGSSGSISYTGTQVMVRGDKINLFEGFVTSAAGGFSMSAAGSEALAQTATEAYSNVLSVARRANDAKEQQQGESFFAGIYQDADAKAEAFGKAVAESINAVGVTFTFGATITGTTDDGVEIGFVEGTAASVACG